MCKSNVPFKDQHIAIGFHFILDQVSKSTFDHPMFILIINSLTCLQNHFYENSCNDITPQLASVTNAQSHEGMIKCNLGKSFRI